MDFNFEKQGDAEARNLIREKGQHGSRMQSKQTQLAEYFKVVGSIDNIRQLSQQKIMANHDKIQWTSEFSEIFNVSTIEFSMQYLAVLVHYYNYQMKISTLLTCFDDEDIKEQIFAEGAFGSIYRILIDGKQYAIKGIKFVSQDIKINIDHIYKEYFLSKIAQLLEVGPKIEQVMGYDVVVLKNRALFAMQMCRAIYQQKSSLIGTQILENIRIMHSQGFMHLDIKPANILYSYSFQKYVFIDFGFSKLLKERLGKKVICSFAGTIQFCSDEMKKAYWLCSDIPVDLYYNDFVALRKTVSYFQSQNQKQSATCFSLNSYQSFKCLNSFVQVFRLKYFISNKKLSQIHQLVLNCSYLIKTFYVILSNDLIGAELRQNTYTKALVEQLRCTLMRNSLNISQFDQKMAKVLSQKEGVALTPHIFTLEYMLRLPKEEFAKGLNGTDFVHRLFLYVDPMPSFISDKQIVGRLQQINSLRKKIINKISICLPQLQKTEVLFYENLRNVVIFFYNKLRVLRQESILISIRSILILMEDFTLINEIEQQICSLIDDVKLRILKAVQFTLFDTQRAELQTQKLDIFHKYAQVQPFYLQKDQIKVYHFANQLLTIGNYIECEEQVRKQMKTVFEELKKQFGQYLQELLNIETLYCSLAKTKMTFYRKSILQFIYMHEYYPNINPEEGSILSFFRLHFQRSYSSEHSESSIKAFEPELSNLFRVLRAINIQQPNFLTVKDNIFFFYDFKLAMIIVKIYKEHIGSFQLLNNQQTFRCFLVFDWLLKIFGGNLNIRKSLQKQKPEDTKEMLHIISSSYQQFKMKTLRFQNEIWYIIAAKSLDCTFLLLQDRYAPFEKNLAEVKKLFAFSNISVMKIFINMTYHTLQKSQEAGQLIPYSIIVQLQTTLLQFPIKYSERTLIELFEKTGLFQLLIKVYIKRDLWEDSFTLIIQLIQKMNKSDFWVNKRGLFYIIKLGIQTFCDKAGILQWITRLNQLSIKPISSLEIQKVYLEYYLLYQIVNYINELPTAPSYLKFSTTSYLLLPPLKHQLMRIGYGIGSPSPFYIGQIQIGLYRCYRLNFQFKSNRKKMMCLRKEGQYKMLRLKPKKVQNSTASMRQKIQKRLANLWENQKYLITTWDFSTIFRSKANDF